MKRARKVITSAAVAAMLSLHACYWSFSSSTGGGCYPYCDEPFDAPTATESTVLEPQSEPQYSDDW